MQHEGLSFPEAVRTVAAKYGIEVPDERKSAYQQRQYSIRDRIFKVNETALIYYQENLRDRTGGQKAMAYLLGRGMTRKILDGFQLGYAPDRWDGFLRFAQSKKLPTDIIEKAGLVIPRKERGGHYDRFRNRVIFPILSVSNQVIGFGGRVMGDDLPKYLNSPETPVYDKGSSLYGIDKARRSAREKQSVFLVEGYFDVLAMHLYGIENSVATLGTALTSEHVKLLRSMVGSSGQVVLVYDSDQAGIKAAQRSIGVFEEGYLDARILILPEQYDPDEYLREYGPDEFFKAADKASGATPFLMDSAVKQFGRTVGGKVKVVAAMQKVLAAVTDPVARSLYVKELAEKLRIDETAVLEQIRQAIPKAQQTKFGSEFGSGVEKRPQATLDSGRLEKKIIAIMLRFPELRIEIVERNLLDNFEDDFLKRIATIIVDKASAGDVVVGDWLSEIEDARCRNIIAELAMGNEHWDYQGCRRILAQFEARNDRRVQRDLQRRIIDAERNKDIELLTELLREKQRQAGQIGK
jgi:DNA primase